MNTFFETLKFPVVWGSILAIIILLLAIYLLDKPKKNHPKINIIQVILSLLMIMIILGGSYAWRKTYVAVAAHEKYVQEHIQYIKILNPDDTHYGYEGLDNALDSGSKGKATYKLKALHGAKLQFYDSGDHDGGKLIYKGNDTYELEMITDNKVGDIDSDYRSFRIDAIKNGKAVKNVKLGIINISDAYDKAKSKDASDKKEQDKKDEQEVKDTPTPKDSSIGKSSSSYDTGSLKKRNEQNNLKDYKNDLKKVPSATKGAITDAYVDDNGSEQTVAVLSGEASMADGDGLKSIAKTAYDTINSYVQTYKPFPDGSLAYMIRIEDSSGNLVAKTSWGNFKFVG